MIVAAEQARGRPPAATFSRTPPPLARFSFELRRRVVRSASQQYPENRPQFPKAPRFFEASPAARPGFPRLSTPSRPLLFRLGLPSRQAPRQLLKPRLVNRRVTLRLDPSLGSDHDHDAHCLRLCSEPVRVRVGAATSRGNRECGRATCRGDARPSRLATTGPSSAACRHRRHAAGTGTRHRRRSRPGRGRRLGALS
jgi:hypothetical protein